MLVYLSHFSAIKILIFLNFHYRGCWILSAHFFDFSCYRRGLLFFLFLHKFVLASYASNLHGFQMNMKLRQNYDLNLHHIYLLILVIFSPYFRQFAFEDIMSSNPAVELSFPSLVYDIWILPAPFGHFQILQFLLFIFLNLFLAIRTSRNAHLPSYFIFARSFLSGLDIYAFQANVDLIL